MAVFEWQGIDAARQGRQGRPRRRQPAGLLRALLRKEGILATAIEEEARRASARAREIDFSGLFQRVSTQDVALITRQLATLLRAGVPLVEALSALIEQVEKPELQRALTQIARQGQRRHELRRRAARRTRRSSRTCT